MRLVGAGIVIVALLNAGCGGEQLVQDDIDPVGLLESSAIAMAELESASFQMERTGAPVTIERMTFDQAAGQYAAPNNARALLGMRAGDLVVELGTISTGGRTWLTNPLTGDWEVIDPDLAFNPALIFDPETGWPAVLAEVSDPEYVGRAGDRHHVRGTVPGERIGTLMAGLAAPEPAVLEMQFDVESTRLVRVEFDTTGENGTSSWVIDLDAFDEPVQIEPPATE